MPFDAVFLTAVTDELRQAVGARVDKINQPSRETVLLQLRSPAGSWKLLLDANTGHPRLHFTTESFDVNGFTFVFLFDRFKNVGKRSVFIVCIN